MARTIGDVIAGNWWDDNTWRTRYRRSLRGRPDMTPRISGFGMVEESVSDHSVTGPSAPGSAGFARIGRAVTGDFAESSDSPREVGANNSCWDRCVPPNSGAPSNLSAHSGGL